MKPTTLIVPFLLAASLATASLATAQQSPPPPQGEHGMHRPHDLMLTEAQQDKLFAQRHAAEPARREREKAIRRAHEGLRDLADSGRFDEGKASALAQSLGQAMAAEALDHARGQAQFLAMLTPEQRAKMQQGREQRREHPEHEGRGPGQRP